MTKKIIISDLDGTLLNPDHKISAYTKAVFNKAHQNGYLIIIATGRHHLDALPLLDTMGFPLYLVSSNGAKIHSPEKELLFSFTIDSHIIKSVLKIDFDPDITTVVFKENVWQTNKINEKLNSFQTELNYLPEIVNLKEIDTNGIIKLFFVHEDHQKLVAVREKILAKHDGLFNHAFSLPICLEFMDVAVDKSYAIEKILALENSRFNQTIAFGDGFNDEKMLRAANQGFIMQNATIDLKNKLPHLTVIDSNANDGVAKYIEMNLL
jgi:Cof subfamily protein (haloacid dehalogenase superfamily)